MPTSPVASPPTVLVVEDEPAVRFLAQRFLTHAGYRAFAAVDGADALSVLDHIAGPVDLVVTDVVMPRLDGVALVRELLGRNPEQRVLFMSAQPVHVLAQHQV